MFTFGKIMSLLLMQQNSRTTLPHSLNEITYYLFYNLEFYKTHQLHLRIIPVEQETCLCKAEPLRNQNGFEGATTI